MAYLYRHIRLDKNEVFYVGIGSDPLYKRVYCKYKRSDHWNRIVKNSAIEIEIILDDLTWEDACKKEIEFITLYGRRDINTGSLVNLTNGGEGSLGILVTNETLQKRSIAVLGSNNPMYGRSVGKEYGYKISNSLTGKKLSNSTRSKQSISHMIKVIDTKTGVQYNSMSDAALKFNVHVATIGRWTKQSNHFLKVVESCKL